MGNLTLQAGAGAISASIDPRLQIAVVRVRCWAPDLATAISSACPDVGVSLMEWRPRSITAREGGTQEGYDVECNLEGPTSSGATGVYYTLEATTSEDDILTNANIQTLLKVYNGTITNGVLTFDTPLSNGHPNPMYGVQRYLVPGAIWIQRFTIPALTADFVHDLATIQHPPGDNLPATAGNQNWLFIRCRGTQRGNCWECEKAWQLSGPRGFIPEMYPLPEQSDASGAGLGARGGNGLSTGSL